MRINHTAASIQSFDSNNVCASSTLSRCTPAISAQGQPKLCDRRGLEGGAGSCSLRGDGKRRTSVFQPGPPPLSRHDRKSPGAIFPNEATVFLSAEEPQSLLCSSKRNVETIALLLMQHLSPPPNFFHRESSLMRVQGPAALQ